MVVATPVKAAASGWHPLLEDHGASAWRGWKTADLPAGWHVAGGVLSKDGPVDDLVKIQRLGNFEVELEGKMGKGGDSGPFYRGTRQYVHIYLSWPGNPVRDDAPCAGRRQRVDR